MRYINSNINGKNNNKKSAVFRETSSTFRFTVMYDVEIDRSEKVEDAIKKLKLYMCSKCENPLKNVYKTKTGRDSHEAKKHNFER